MGVACVEMLPSGTQSEIMTGKAGYALSEEFLTYHFKVTPCNRKYPHNWASCLCGHKGERANRRDLRIYNYLPIACEYAQQKLECPLGDACPHSHNMFEYWLHPRRYKTEMCLFRANCDRLVCFFAHSAEELRTLDPSLPPAEVCWSAGAALPGKKASSNSSNCRESGSGPVSGQAAAVAGVNKQQQRQQYLQQKLHIQQQQQQLLPAQGRGAGIRQQQDTMSSPAALQQPAHVQMAPGEFALRAAVNQPLQQQHVVTDTHRHGLACGITSPVQTASNAAAIVQQLQPPAISMVPPDHQIDPAASIRMSPAVLGPLQLAGAAAAPVTAGGWPQQLLLDYLQLQLQQQQQELQQQCYTNLTSLNPALQQQQSTASAGSGACAPHGLLHQQAGHRPGLTSGGQSALQPLQTAFGGSLPGAQHT